MCFCGKCEGTRIKPNLHVWMCLWLLAQPSWKNRERAQGLENYWKLTQWAEALLYRSSNNGSSTHSLSQGPASFASIGSQGLRPRFAAFSAPCLHAKTKHSYSQCFALPGLQLAAIVWHLHDVPITKPVGHMEDCCFWESRHFKVKTNISTRNHNRIRIQQYTTNINITNRYLYMYVCVKHKSIQIVTSLLASDHHIWNNCPSVSSP